MEEEVLDENLRDGQVPRFFNNRPIVIWGALLLIGLGLRIAGAPFAALSILLGSAGLTSYCLHGFLRPTEPTTLNTVLVIIGFVWLVILLYGASINGGHPYNLNGLGTYGVAFIFTLLTNQIRYNAKRKKHSRSN